MLNDSEDLKKILIQLEQLNQKVDYLTERQRKQAELIEEMTPIAREAMNVATQKLAEWERNGHVAFARELLGIGDEVLNNFSVEDAHMLRENIVAMLQVVKRMTRPRMLALAANVTNAVEAEPHATGLVGMLKASNDADTRRGMATALAILKEVGRSVSHVSGQRMIGSEKLSRHLASTGVAKEPSKPASSLSVNMPKAPTATRAADRCEPSTVATSKSPVANLPGWSLTSEGFIEDPTSWTPAFSEQMAAALGIGSLSEDHWKVINFAREEYLRTGKSPNVRLLSSGSGVSTKEIYTLFQKAPGLTAARVAGVPKPVGCI